MSEHAAEQLVRLAHAHPGELTVLELGPLTNLALALHLEPRLPTLVRRVVWMGGVIGVAGNIGPEADANAYHDPAAAEFVLRSGFPLTVVPMDVTRHAWVDQDWLATLAAGPHAAARQLAGWMQHYVTFHTQHLGRPGCLLHDPVAAAIAVHPKLATTTDELQVTCLDGPPAIRGATKIDRREHPFGPSYPPRPRSRSFCVLTPPPPCTGCAMTSPLAPALMRPGRVTRPRPRAGSAPPPRRCHRPPHKAAAPPPSTRAPVPDAPRPVEITVAGQHLGQVPPFPQRPEPVTGSAQQHVGLARRPRAASTAASRASAIARA